MRLFLAAACKWDWQGPEIRGQARQMYGSVLGGSGIPGWQRPTPQDNTDHMAKLQPMGAQEAVATFFLPVPDEGLVTI